MRRLIVLPLLLPAACGAASSQPAPPPAAKADRLLVDKSDRILIAYSGDREIARYTNIRFGDAPTGHKQFEGDERTPEGDYRINGRNPKSAYHLSLRISYPNAADRAYARAQRRSPGGDIFIHGQPNRWPGPTLGTDWTDGCIALSNAEIKQLWDLVPDGTPITIRP
jgi:murein L,D-transpeptidase YafK